MTPVGCNGSDSRGPQFSFAEYTFFLLAAGYCVAPAGQSLSKVSFFRYGNDVHCRSLTESI